jgi:hypothetical protein
VEVRQLLAVEARRLPDVVVRRRVAVLRLPGVVSVQVRQVVTVSGRADNRPQHEPSDRLPGPPGLNERRVSRLRNRSMTLLRWPLIRRWQPGSVLAVRRASQWTAIPGLTRVPAVRRAVGVEIAIARVVRVNRDRSTPDPVKTDRAGILIVMRDVTVRGSSRTGVGMVLRPVPNLLRSTVPAPRCLSVWLLQPRRRLSVRHVLPTLNGHNLIVGNLIARVRTGRSLIRLRSQPSRRRRTARLPFVIQTATVAKPSRWLATTPRGGLTPRLSLKQPMMATTDLPTMFRRSCDVHHGRRRLPTIADR